MMTNETAAKPESTQQRLERLGLTAIAANLTKLKLRRRKLMIAYEHYRYLTSEKISEFQRKLHSKTYSRSQGTYQTLSFVPLASYLKVPPEDVLLKLEEAIGRNCFDHFEVAYIREVKVDPLLLGTIDGCDDYFYIAGWDNDVKIEDILDAHEG